MLKYSLMTDEEMIKAIARAYEQTRLALNLTEEEVCQKGGVSKDAIHRFKNGKNINLKNFLAILRAVDSLDALDALFLSTQSFSPLPEKNKAPKKRIYKKRKSALEDVPFVWGEDI